MFTEIDRQIVQRCLAHEAQAWRDFVDRFVGLIAAVVDHLDHAQDLRMAVPVRRALCLTILRRIAARDYELLRRFPGDSSLATYVTVVARRIALREVR